MQNDENTPIVEQDENDTTTEEVEFDSTDSNQDEDDSNEDSTDWKAEALKYKAILDRNKDNKPKIKRSTASNDLDYGAKAFLAVQGIKGGDELKLVKDFMANTGKDLDSVIDSKHFKAELEEMRELKRTADASPSGNKRSGQSSRDSVDYWIAKGELPPVSDSELRQKVVNARMKKETLKSVFYNG